MAGSIRSSEAQFTIIISTALLLTRALSSGDRKWFKPLLGSLLGLGLLSVSLVSTVIVARDPIAQYGYTKKTDTAAAAWAASRVREPYYADAFMTGLVLLNRPWTNNIVELREGNLEETVTTTHASPLRFVGALQRAGARFVLLTNRDIDKPGEPGVHSFLTPEWYVLPLPNYRYDDRRLGTGIIYENGGTRVIQVPPAD